MHQRQSLNLLRRLLTHQHKKYCLHYPFLASSSSSSSSSSIDKPLSSGTLLQFIRDKIRTSGPIPVAEYMQLCVGSQMGYYSRKEEVFGAKGDFITSPELTQVFGELIGAWIVHELQMTGWEGRWQLVELGPGSGELMADLLGVLHKLGVPPEMVDIHLVERSERLAARQRHTLETRMAGKEMPLLHWHQSLDDVPLGFTVFVANEFFDALPVHLFVRDQHIPNKWHEQYVNLDKDGQELCFMLSHGENLHTQAWIPQQIRAHTERTQWEYCPEAHKTMLRMVQRFTVHGGFALVIDYGHDGSRHTHSLRAYKGHQLVDPLQSPGEVDLTADVDFGGLATSVRDMCLVFGPVEQRQFLGGIGLAQRVNYLLGKCKSTEERRGVLDACRMLIAEDQMGTRFKALALFPSTMAEIFRARGGAPAGFFSFADDGKKEVGKGK